MQMDFIGRKSREKSSDHDQNVWIKNRLNPAASAEEMKLDKRCWSFNPRPLEKTIFHTLTDDITDYHITHSGVSASVCV